VTIDSNDLKRIADALDLIALSLCDKTPLMHADKKRIRDAETRLRYRIMCRVLDATEMGRRVP